jgi:phosphatidylglycerophosphate synthase
MRRSVPSMVTAARLGGVPLLVFLVARGMLFYGALLFLLLLCTDVLDGYLARRLAMSSRFGAYFDATTDFVLVLSMLAVFDSEGFVADWVLVVVTVYFALFVVSSLRWGRIHDPLGRHYGTLLFAAIGLRFLASGEFFYDVATFVITGYTLVCVYGRALDLSQTGAAARGADNPDSHRQESPHGLIRPSGLPRQP